MHDEARITVRSGAGGQGAISFRREKYVDEGGPDGGDGGRGGDVVLIASVHADSLTPYVRKRRWKAQSGAPGGGRNCTGAAGKDLELEVPLGTIVKEASTGVLLADLTEHGQRLVVAAGGRGGAGNARFATATNRTPRRADPGQPGTEIDITLELKLIADVGIIGYPNAGKSTLLSRLSAARPKVGPYPFTTLTPQLGVVERPDRTLILADIPGLIEGASQGVGLGHQFLRHVERCALLLHLVDASEGDAGMLRDRIDILNRELSAFGPLLAHKPQLVVLNKADLRDDLPQVAKELATLLGVDKVAVISGVSGQGLTDLENLLLREIPARGERTT